MASGDILSLAPPPADRVVRYGEARSQFGELRLPSGGEAGRTPVVVVLHGGFWREQYSLSHIGQLCGALTREGWATWSLEYRRLGESGGGWPGTFLDVAGGLEALRTLAEEHALDLERVVTVGHSAGGQLALWLAARGGGRVPVGSEIAPSGEEEAPTVRGAVALAAVSDLRMAVRLGLSANVAAQLLGGGPERYPERYAAGSPVELLPLNGRTVLVHGESDEIVPVELSRAYWRQATGLGDEAELVTLGGAGHFEVIDPRSWAYASVRDAVKRVLED
jgi:acetyl esterase/lipase